MEDGQATWPPSWTETFTQPND